MGFSSTFIEITDNGRSYLTNMTAAHNGRKSPIKLPMKRTRYNSVALSFFLHPGNQPQLTAKGINTY
jgi:hypothetical protein